MPKWPSNWGCLLVAS